MNHKKELLWSLWVGGEVPNTMYSVVYRKGSQPGSLNLPLSIQG